MRNILKRTLGRGPEDQKGFTLIELLVVVGIIVALAAVIVPLVIQFAGEGEEGAWATELAVVQAAMDTMMTEETALTVTPRLILGVDVIAAVDNPVVGGTTDFGTYIREMPTTCEYTWDATGQVLQHVLAGAVCEPG